LIKTKEFAAILKALKLTKLPSWSARPGWIRNCTRAARNIDGLELLPAKESNAYTVLKQKRLLLTRAALEELRQGAKKTEAAATK